MLENEDFDENDVHDESIYIIADEDGKELLVKVVDEIEVKGIGYKAVIPISDLEDADGESCRVIIFREDLDAEGEYNLTAIDDENELDEVWNMVLPRLQEKIDEIIKFDDEE